MEVLDPSSPWKWPWGPSVSVPMLERGIFSNFCSRAEEDDDGDGGAYFFRRGVRGRPRGVPVRSTTHTLGVSVDLSLNFVDLPPLLTSLPYFSVQYTFDLLQHH